MMIHRKLRLGLLILAVAAVTIPLCLAAPPLPAPKFVPIDYPQADMGNTQARHINDKGQILGVYGDLASPKGFVLERGFFIPLHVPGPAGSSLDAITISNNGQIAGSFRDHTQMPRGFMLNKDKQMSINYPKAKFTHVFGINNSGDAVGTYLNGTEQHGFLLKKGAYSTIHLPDSDADYASGFAINDKGQIVGNFAIKNHEHGYLLTKGDPTLIDFPKANVTIPFGLNNKGEVVGIYFSGQPNDHGRGFLWSQGTFTPIDYPGVSDGTQAFGINSQGEIVGAYLDSQGHSHGFLRIP